MRVLIVEDDPELAGLLHAGLRAQQMEPTVAATLADGRDRLAQGRYDVIILDVRLPDGSGFDLCQALRSGGVETPVLMLTALDAVDDRVRGFEVGADDYLTKPFAVRELIVRLRALARRRPALVPALRRIADLEANLTTREVRRGGRPLRLTAKEFALLELFLDHPGEVLDRPTITAHVWDDNHDPFANVLEVLVRRLRRKIDDDFEPKLITTLRGAGYRFGS